jgi:hypothetical protein
MKVGVLDVTSEAVGIVVRVLVGARRSGRWNRWNGRGSRWIGLEGMERMERKKEW